MMDKKRKFEGNAEEEPNNKIFGSDPLSFDDSFSKTASLQDIKCLICAREIPLRSESETQILEDQVSPVRLLGHLLKVLKLSPEVCRRLLENTSSTVTVLYCESCEEAILSCLKIAQEIDHLQNVWENISNQIKGNFIKDHHCRLEPGGNAFIRKTLVQCWTTCTVRIKPLPLPTTNKLENQVDVDIHETIGTPNQIDNADKDDETDLQMNVASGPRRCNRKEQILNYFVDINVDKNMVEIDSGSEYAPDLDSEEEEEEKMTIFHEDKDEEDPLLDVEPEVTNKLNKEMLQIYERSKTCKFTSSSSKPQKKTEKTSERQRPVRVLRAGILKISDKHRLQEFPFNCSICGKGYHQTNKLKVHEEAHGDTEELSNSCFPFTCSVCTGQRFKSVSSLDCHMSKCHKKETVSGSKTNVFEEVVLAEEVERVSRSPKPKPDTDVAYDCQKCSLTFEDSTALKEHEKSSHGHPRYVVCPECPEKFANVITGRTHQIRIHGKSLSTSCDAEGSLGSFICVYCKEEFVKSSFLIEDNSTEPPTKRFSFPDLPLPAVAVASAKSEALLQNNELVDLFRSFHWNHRMYCKSRPRFASVLDNLDVSNSVKHGCKLCLKEFSAGSALRDHEITAHTKEFKFYCEVCGSPFPSRGKLNNHHRRVHRGKQFKCERCPKTFKTNEQLKGHKNTHDDIRHFVCDLCGKAYCTKKVLYMHKRQSHKNVKH